MKLYFERNQKLLIAFKSILALFTFIFIFACKEEYKTSPKELYNKKHYQQLVDSIKNKKIDPKIRLDKADQLIYLGKLSKNDSIQFDAFIEKSTLLQELKMDNSVIEFNHKIINWAKEKLGKDILGNAYFNYGNYFYEKYNTDSAYYYFNNSKNEFIKLKDKKGIAKTSINIAMILNDLASYFESEKSSLEALENIKGDPKHPYLAPIYNNLAVSSGSLLNYDEELYWYGKALELTDDPYYIASIKHNQAVAMTLLKKYDEAINILSEIQKTAIYNDDLPLRARVIDNLAYAKWLKNNKANVLTEYYAALKIYTQEHDYFGMSTTYDHLIDYYKNSDPKKSLEFANEKYKITNQSNNTEGKINALKRIILLQPNTENIEEFINLSDSIQYLNSNSKYQFAKLQYDADTNRDKITSLSLEKAEDKLKLQRAKISIIIAIAIVTIGAVSFGFYTYYIRQKRKQDLIKATYDTEVALSQKLHDELANDLFSTLTLIDSVPFENQEFKQRLEHNLNHIYAQTRKISRETNSIDVDHFESELDSMLASYKSNEVNILTSGINEILWDKIDNEIKIVIYRVLMEFMTNMKKHSNCSLVVIKIIMENKKLLVTYIDNGTNLNLDVSSKRNGIRNVENRIASIKGTINFDFSKGFKSFISIPISKF